MGREIVEAAEALLDRELPVLDHGFVRLVDYLGGDQRIVQAARVSYGAGTRTVREDAGLIDYLLRNRHTSPFEQVMLTFHTKMPIFVARQWVRHRTARLNEISGRYSVMQDEFYVPDPAVVAPQATNNKQGRAVEGFDDAEREEIRETFREGQRHSYAAYEQLIERNVARELARINLPLSTYTEWYWQIDLHNLYHFLALRLDPHAQYEIRAYAEAMLEIARAVCPLATASFEEHMVGSVTFSRTEFAALQALLAAQGNSDGAGATPEPGATPAAGATPSAGGTTAAGATPAAGAATAAGATPPEAGTPPEAATSQPGTAAIEAAGRHVGLSGRPLQRFVRKVTTGAMG